MLTAEDVVDVVHHAKLVTRLRYDAAAEKAVEVDAVFHGNVPGRLMTVAFRVLGIAL